MDKRRKFTPQFKAKVVLELLSGAKSPAQACREYGLRDSLVYKFRGPLHYLLHPTQRFKMYKKNLKG